MNNDQLIQTEFQGSQTQVPQIPPAEWMMVGFSCAVQDLDFGGQTMKTLIFKRGDVYIMFPMDASGARHVGNQLLGKPTIAVPQIEVPKL